MDPVRGVTIRMHPAEWVDDMRDWREPAHEEEDGALRATCYLLAALCIGICVALLIIVERL